MKSTKKSVKTGKNDNSLVNRLINRLGPVFSREFWSPELPKNDVKIIKTRPLPDKKNSEYVLELVKYAYKIGVAESHKKLSQKVIDVKAVHMISDFGTTYFKKKKRSTVSKAKVR